MSIKQHCKGCALLHTYNTKKYPSGWCCRIGMRADKAIGYTYNTKKYPSGWCCRIGMRADKAIGHCKLNGLKVQK